MVCLDGIMAASPGGKRRESFKSSRTKKNIKVKADYRGGLANCSQCLYIRSMVAVNQVFY